MSCIWPKGTPIHLRKLWPWSAGGYSSGILWMFTSYVGAPGHTRKDPKWSPWSGSKRHSKLTCFAHEIVWFQMFWARLGSWEGPKGGPRWWYWHKFWMHFQIDVGALFGFGMGCKMALDVLLGWRCEEFTKAHFEKHVLLWANCFSGISKVHESLCLGLWSWWQGRSTD